jgi:hypothetical protein
MNQNVVKNLRNTRTNTELRERLKERQARLGDNYCEPCAKWEYGFSRKRCTVHNATEKAATLRSSGTN